jgi:hypothetical protein
LGDGPTCGSSPKFFIRIRKRKNKQRIEVIDLTLSLSALLAPLDYSEEIVLTEDQHPVARPVIISVY